MRQICGRLAMAIALGGALLLAANANAGVNQRETRQRARIAAGVEDGTLTGAEAQRLYHQQAKIERMEQRFRNNDGYLGPGERFRLRTAQERAAGNIFRKRHNARTN